MESNELSAYISYLVTTGYTSSRAAATGETMVAGADRELTAKTGRREGEAAYLAPSALERNRGSIEHEDEGDDEDEREDEMVVPARDATRGRRATLPYVQLT